MYKIWQFYECWVSNGYLSYLLNLGREDSEVWSEWENENDEKKMNIFYYFIIDFS